MIESAAADAIVTFFKVRSMPNQTEVWNIQEFIIYQMFLKFNFFQTSYEAPWLFKVGHCACTNVGVYIRRR